MKKVSFLIMLLFIVTGCSPNKDKSPTGPEEQQPVVDSSHEARQERLKYGFNYDGLRFGNDMPTLLEMTQKKNMGFRHVRLAFGVEKLFDPANPLVINPQGLVTLKNAINLILSADLAVVVDMHDAPDELWQDEIMGDKYAQFWSVLAGQLKSFESGYVFFESVNEPVAEYAKDWNVNQNKIITAVRNAAPEHTVIADANLRVSPNKWDQIGSMVQLDFYDDPYVIYTFHFYESMTFTHQGATWGDDNWQYLKAVPYPSTPNNVAVSIAASDPRVKGYIQSYGDARWNAAKILERFSVAGKWAQENNAFVYCGELGCINWTDAPKGSREAWYRDVKAAIDFYNMGWAIWFSVDDEVEAGLDLN